MQASPWLSIGLNAAYAVLTGLTVPVVDALGFTGHDAQIVAWAGILAVPLNMVLHAYSSTDPGPLAPKDSAPVAAAQKMVDAAAEGAPTGAIIEAKKAAVTAIQLHSLGILSLALLAFVALSSKSFAANQSPIEFENATSAQAPSVKHTLPPAAGSITGTPCTDLINLLPIGCVPASAQSQQSGGALGGALGDIVNFFASDFQQAATLATEIPGLQDNNGKACWTQLQSVGALLKAHPLPVSFKAATDLEALRLFSMSINQTCANPACTQLFTDLSTGIAQLGVGMPIPSITALCAKIPSITPGIAPVATPVVTTPAAN